MCKKKIDSIRLVLKCLQSDVTIKYIVYDDYEYCKEMYNMYRKMSHFVNFKDNIIVHKDFSAIKDLIDLFLVNIRYLDFVDDIEFKLNSLLDIIDEMMSDAQIVIERVERIVEIVEEIKSIYEKIYSFDVLSVNDISIISLENIDDYKDDYIIIYDSKMHDKLVFDLREENVLELEQYQLYYMTTTLERYNTWLNYIRTPDKDKIRGLVVGMSYIQVGTNLSRFTYPTVSLAAPSQDLFYDVEMLKYAYNNGVNNLEYVIMEVCPYKLWYDMSLSKKTRLRSLYYVPQTGTTHNLEDGYFYEQYFLAKKELYDNLFEKDYICLKFEEIKSKNHLFEKNRTDIAHYSTVDEYNAAKIDIENLFDKNYPHTYEENKKILHNMLEFCKARGIYVIIVMPPFPNVFKEGMNQQMYECTVDCLNQLKTLYSEVSVLDYTFCELFDDCYFYDNAHLNYFGGNLLTDLLNGEINRIIGRKE